MIIIDKGNIFDSGCMALVNPVNCVGIAGKGLALEFKKRYPENYREYVEACEAGALKLGGYPYMYTGPDACIFNFPTKNHWRDISYLHYIGISLTRLRWQIIEYNISSIAIPALGCGEGGLWWPDVKQQMEVALFDLPAYIRVYAPH